MEIWELLHGTGADPYSEADGTKYCCNAGSDQGNYRAPSDPAALQKFAAVLGNMSCSMKLIRSGDKKGYFR